jgi:hypothetical protein
LSTRGLGGRPGALLVQSRRCRVYRCAADAASISSTVDPGWRSPQRGRRTCPDSVTPPPAVLVRVLVRAPGWLVLRRVGAKLLADLSRNGVGGAVAVRIRPLGAAVVMAGPPGWGAPQEWSPGCWARACRHHAWPPTHGLRVASQLPPAPTSCDHVCGPTSESARDTAAAFCSPANRSSK